MATYSSSSLTLRALLKSAAGRLGMGVPGGPVNGLTPPAAAMYAAVSGARGRTLLVVPTDALVESMTSDARFFLCALEGWSSADADRAVLPFPSHEVDPYRGLAPHLDIASARAHALDELVHGHARLVIASAAALLPRLSPPARLAATSVTLTPGQEISPIALGDLLAEAGYTRQDPVDQSGEFCVRGGVVDFFPAGAPQPVRLEFVGDTIESIRPYDPATQRSIGEIDQASVAPLQELFGDGERQDRSATVFDYLWAGQPPAVLTWEPEEVDAQALRAQERVRASHDDALARGLRVPPPNELFLDWDEAKGWLEGGTRLETLAIEGDGRHVACQPAQEFAGRIQDWVAEIRRGRERGDTVVFIAHSPGRAERTIEVLRDYDIFAAPMEGAEETHSASVLVGTGHLSKGFRLVDAALQFYAETDVFEEERRTHERRRSAARTFLSDFRDLKVGDLVVHVDHGIGVFVGLKRIDVGTTPQEFMELRYAGEDKLFVPVERLDLVQKYSGASRPSLDRLGGTTWEKAKTRVKKAMRDMAEELLKLYAARKAVPGHAFSPDSHWQQEFEDAFEWDLTPDQRTAIDDIKRDMESPTPDGPPALRRRRLRQDGGGDARGLQGRHGRQAGRVLAPTTVLAFQHLKTLKDRFAAFPVRIDMVSRFRTKAEQKQTLEDLAAGKVEIIVGTHRLLSKDVRFRDLGLLVVDEEQRFGVAHKERIKQMRKRVDVLTMTATPIPRTLNMSLAGIRDMSIIETPPKDRLSIQTNVVKFDQEVIAAPSAPRWSAGPGVLRPQPRGVDLLAGQPDRRGSCPRRGWSSATGRWRGRRSSARWWTSSRASTTCCWRPRSSRTASTSRTPTRSSSTAPIATGSSQLYQLRGRVGRSDRRAYAYLLVPPDDSLSPGREEAARRHPRVQRPRQRLPRGGARPRDPRRRQPARRRAERPHRGGRLRHVHEAARADDPELKGEELDDDPRQREPARRPAHRGRYIPDMNQRLTVYRRMAAVRAEDELTA
jgi:transcription-repair coupling factor (superfamily II helicase)